MGQRSHFVVRFDIELDFLAGKCADSVRGSAQALVKFQANTDDATAEATTKSELT